MNMRRAWSTSLVPRLGLALMAALVVVAARGVPPAEAAVIAAKNWRVQPAATMTTEMAVIVNGSGSIDGYPLDLSTVRFAIDGEVVPRSSYTATTPFTRNLYLYYMPSPRLTDGPHTFYVHIADTLGRISAYQWTCTVALPPSASWTSPDNRSVNYNGLPVIGMSLSDNTPTTQFTVAGQVRSGSATGEVVATFGGSGLASGEQTFSLASELSPGSYYLTATVTDSAGVSRALTGGAARSFSVISAEAMSVFTSDCLDCHVRENHPASGRTCAGCHTQIYHEYADCQDCHSGHSGPVTVTGVLGDCTVCHNAQTPGTPRHTAQSVDTAHAASCDGCHTGSLIATHAFAPTGSSYAYQCDLCHFTSNQRVKDAVAAQDTTCSACHGGPDSGHEALHTFERTDDCVVCHEGDSLTQVHIANGTLGCDGCHESEDAEVVAAIAADALECSGCHVQAGVDFHLNMAEAHTSPVSTYETCSGCHHSWGSSPIRGHDITRHEGGCATCHNETLDLTGKTALCSSCHITEGSGTPPEGFHTTTEDHHTPDTAASQECAGCHETANVRLLHVTDSCSTCHNGLCQDCHSVHGMGGVGLLNGVECARCHTTDGVDYHAEFDTKHTADVEGCSGERCHDSSLVDTHAAFVGTGNRYPEYADTCELCHMNADPARVPTDATAACDSCHDPQPHGDLTAAHASTVTNGVVNVFDYHEGYSNLGWDVPCTLCHASTNLLTAHANDCTTCHGGTQPVDSLTSWNKSCSQGACHPDLKHAGDYAHDQYDCEAACHEWNWDVYYSSCDYCHNQAGAAPVTTSDVKATYTGTATITFGTSNFAWTYYRLDGGPKRSGQVALVLPPASGSQNHTIEYWSVTDTGLEELPHKTANFTIDADTMPPVTSSNALASYVGPATITLTPSDNGSTPVSQTYWRLNGGAQQAGRTITVPQPASGTQQHTLEFWSVDASGNEELPHRSWAFSVTADLVAPTGTIVINAGDEYTRNSYGNLTLSASDPGGSGVKQMRLSNDSVNWTAWETYVTSRSYWSFSASNGVKTVYVQYRDGAGNVGSASDTITYDSTAPIGTMYINANAASTASSDVTLNNSITDSLAGMGEMRFSNDNSTWSTWEPYAATKDWRLAAGTGTRTVYGQFRDRAGNLLYRNDSITVAFTDTTAPTGSISINSDAQWTTSTAVTLTLSATDTGGSGLSHMRLSNDGVTWGAWEVYAASKAWTLPAGDGAKTVYVQYRDVANNASGTYSDSIQLDTTVPTGSISINGGAGQTADPSVVLTLNASDGSGSGVSQMCFSEDGVTWGAWEAYATSKAWVLPGEDGIKKVYVRFRDVAGLESSPYSDTIVLGDPETDPPTGSVVIQGGAADTPTSDVTLTLSADDGEGSGVTNMRFSNDNVTWSTWEGYATAKSWTLAAGSGVRTVYAQFRDAAGNVSTVYSDTITVLPQYATLLFTWHPQAWAEAHLIVRTTSGTVVIDQWVSGYGSDLDLSVQVLAGQNYYMECEYYWDDEYWDEGGGYGIWSNDPSINPDGILSQGETVVWQY